MEDTHVDAIRMEDNIYLWDRASGYTKTMFYNALDDDILTLSGFRNRLFKENNNLDQADVNALFSAYYY